MKMRYIIMAVVSATMVYACDTRLEPTLWGNDPEAVNISASVACQHVKSNPNGTGEDLRVFNVNDVIGVVTPDLEVQYEKVGSKWAPTDKYYFRWNNDPVTFRAWYPIGNNVDCDNFTIRTNQYSIVNLVACDYMTGEAKDMYREDVNITMYRRNAKIVIKLEGVEDGKKVQAFKIGTYHKVADGSPVGLTTVSPYVTLAEGKTTGENGTVYTAIVIPGPADAAAKFVTFNYYGTDMVKTSLPAFQEGCQYEYTLTLSGTSFSLSTPVVRSWTDGFEMTELPEEEQPQEPEQPDVPQDPEEPEQPQKVVDYFVTPSGAGEKTGLDWENAMGMAELRALLRTNTPEIGTVLDDVTFHCAGGKYIVVDEQDSKRLKVNFGEVGEPVNVSFIGGYNPASTGVDKFDRNVQTYVTNFTGDYNDNNALDADDTGIMCLDSYAYFTFDGFTFSNAYGPSKWRQGAFVMNTDNSLELVLNNCRFVNLKSCDNSTDGKGAALFVMGNSIVKATDCTFNNCVSQSNGGAIAVDNASGIVELNGCQFTGCTSSNGMGGAIGMNAGGKVNVSGCTFTACSALSGGAVVMNSGGEMSVTNSTFDACTATNEHGAAIKLTQSSPLMKLNGCVFKNGDPKKRAGAIYQDSKSILFMNGCSFYGNKTNDNWGSSIVSLAHMYMNNCTFGEDLKGGQLINGAGNWCIVNTTAVSVNDGANELRNTAFRYTGNGYLLVMNTIALYTNSANNKGGIYSETNSINSYGYNAYDKATNFTATTSDLTGQTLSSLGLTWNTGYYSWNGPSEEQPKATLAEVENAIKTGCPVAYGSYTNLGQTFYDWLQEIGDGKNPLAYDQLGNARNTSAMWPGAYEKH